MIDFIGARADLIAGLASFLAGSTFSFRSYPFVLSIKFSALTDSLSSLIDSYTIHR